MSLYLNMALLRTVCIHVIVLQIFLTASFENFKQFCPDAASKLEKKLCWTAPPSAVPLSLKGTFRLLQNRYVLTWKLQATSKQTCACMRWRSPRVSGHSSLLLIEICMQQVVIASCFLCNSKWVDSNCQLNQKTCIAAALCTLYSRWGVFGPRNWMVRNGPSINPSLKFFWLNLPFEILLLADSYRFYYSVIAPQ